MTTTLFTLAALTLTPAAETYPNSTILIEAEALAKLDPARVAILDARDEGSYNAGHIPGAIRMPSAEWGRAVPDTPAGWAKRLASLGIAPETPVVVYGSPGTPEVARAWWLLKYAGAENVRLLNGGYPTWEKAGGKSETRANIARPVSVAKATVKPGRLAEKKDVLSILKEGKVQVLDARTEDEHCGKTSAATRAGHIPGSIWIEWVDLLDKDKRFKSPEELKKLFADRGIDLNKPAVTYCQSGGRASVLAFALELMGAKDVRNYYKSWAEWGNAEDTPVAVPKK